MKLFLDDIRNPEDCIHYMHKRIGSFNPIYLAEDWIIARNYDDFVRIITASNHIITHVSFDHDLAIEHYAPQEMWDDPEKVQERIN
jgi:hypothetical protein